MNNKLLRLAIHSTYYPSLWISRTMCALGGWHWWDAIDDTVFLGAVPSRNDLRQLRDRGVHAVVNLCEEFGGHLPEMAELGMVQLHLPTLDYHPPMEDDLIRGIRFIGEHAAAGHRVYAHCKAGRGRSAILAVCYLMAAKRISAETAYAQVKAARPHVTAGLHDRPVVRAIEKRLANGDIIILQGLT